MKKNNIKVAALLAIALITAVGMVSADAIQTLLDRPLGFVRKYKPDVTIHKQTGVVKASKAEQLVSGDTLSTDQNGFALVQFIDKSIAKIKPNSQLIVQGEVKGKQNSSTRLNVESGELFFNVTKRSTTNFEVATNNSVASVKGTLFGARSDSYFWILEGIIELLANKSGETVTLTQKMYGQVNSDGTIETGELTDEEADSLQENYDSFENELEPKIIKLRFRDENGEIKIVALEYFEN